MNQDALKKSPSTGENRDWRKAMLRSKLLRVIRNGDNSFAATGREVGRGEIIRVLREMNPTDQELMDQRDHGKCCNPTKSKCQACVAQLNECIDEILAERKR